MRIPIALEDIGRGNRQELLEMAGPLKDVLGLGPLVKSRAWVAKIGTGMKRKFLRPAVDYSKANSRQRAVHSNTTGLKKAEYMRSQSQYHGSRPSDSSVALKAGKLLK